jgi:mono/diheme cytochrome c family protein
MPAYGCNGRHDQEDSMTRTPFRLTLAGLALLPAIAHYAGGWAVITVDDVPDYVVAKEPVRLSYTVRQHGVTLLDGLTTGQVTARSGDLEVRAAPTSLGEKGRYAATLTLPRTGDWTITIQSGFMNSRTTLLPLTAVATRTAPLPRLAEAERGRRLFVAKGCVTCHVRGELGGEMNVGPALTGRRYPADYLAKFLADPPIASPRQAGSLGMPNLQLKQPEIAALVAFINTEGRVSRR